MNMLENDIPKHRKKKNSSTSKSKEKSKHKHEYTEKCIGKCLAPYSVNKKFWLGLITYCKHCGKVANFSFPTKKYSVNSGLVNASMNVFMTDEEILEHYKGLDVVEVEDIFVKYVPVSKGGE